MMPIGLLVWARLERALRVWRGAHAAATERQACLAVAAQFRERRKRGWGDGPCPTAAASGARRSVGGGWAAQNGNLWVQPWVVRSVEA